jgi:hypothetical protein
MAETLDTLKAQIEALGATTNRRLEQVERRFERIDKRIEDGFAEVAGRFAEQRAYTEPGYDRIENTMNGRSSRLERKLDQVLALLTALRHPKRS